MDLRRIIFASPMAQTHPYCELESFGDQRFKVMAVRQSESRDSILELVREMVLYFVSLSDTNTYYKDELSNYGRRFG